MIGKNNSAGKNKFCEENCIHVYIKQIIKKLERQLKNMK